MSQLEPQIRMTIKNVSGSDIPPRSAVVATGVVTDAATSAKDARSYTTVTKYTAGAPGNVMISGAVTIKAGAYGSAFFDQFLYVSIDPNVTSPLVGEQWGPIPGAWTLGRGGMGFYCQGYSANGGSPKRAMFLRGRGWCWGKLASTLPAGATSGAVTGLFDVWHPDPSNSETLIVSPNSSLLGLTARNYDPSCVGTTGAVCKVEAGLEGYSFYWVGCP